MSLSFKQNLKWNKRQEIQQKLLTKEIAFRDFAKFSNGYSFSFWSVISYKMQEHCNREAALEEYWKVSDEDATGLVTESRKPGVDITADNAIYQIEYFPKNGEAAFFANDHKFFDALWLLHFIIFLINVFVARVVDCSYFSKTVGGNGKFVILNHHIFWLNESKLHLR